MDKRVAAAREKDDDKDFEVSGDKDDSDTDEVIEAGPSSKKR